MKSILAINPGTLPLVEYDGWKIDLPFDSSSQKNLPKSLMN